MSLDCGDCSCVFALTTGGMRTNGGCHCLDDVPSETRMALRKHIRALRDEIAAAKGELATTINRLREARLRVTEIATERDALLIVEKEALALSFAVDMPAWRPLREALSMCAAGRTSRGNKIAANRIYESGPGFVRATECPDCGHTKCGESCVCNCDAAHAEYECDQLRARYCEAMAALEGLELVCAPGMPMLLDNALDTARALLAKAKGQSRRKRETNKRRASADVSRVDELRALLAKAAPRPWIYDARGDGSDHKPGAIRAPEGPEMPIERAYVASWFGVRLNAEGELIAAMRNAFDALLDVAEAARAAIGRWEGSVCVTTPACGNCTACRLVAALAKLETP